MATNSPSLVYAPSLRQVEKLLWKDVVACPQVPMRKFLADVMRAVQSVHAANWVDVFLGLWTAGLRLVKRDRETMQGPIFTHLESRLCMLLSISPLAAGIVIDEVEKGQFEPENISGDDKDWKVIGTRRAALETSIQILGQFESLLVAPLLH